MTNLTVIQKLARVREVERRMAAVSLAASTGLMQETEARIVRLGELSRAVAVGAGGRAGDALASGGECVSRLLAGSMATTAHRQRQSENVQVARHSFGIAEARARIVESHVVIAKRADKQSAERRAALKMPARGAPLCQ